MTHAAIRKAYDLGIDGIWFYAWRVNSTFEDDAVVNWDTNLNYAEAVENEIHDFDELFTAYANSIYTNSELYLSDIGHGETPLTGQVADYDFSYVTAVSSGDLMGEEGNDTYYLDGKIVYSHPSYSATWYNRSSFPNGDGDDELFSGFLNFFSPSTAYIDGNALNPKNNLRDSSNVVFLASTVGDFDGDGDGELVTAIQDGNTCKIYYSDDGNDIYQYEVYSGTYWRVTAMTTGDFDGKGRDRLVTAFTSPSYTHTAIYLSNPMWGQSPVAGSIYNSRGGVDIHVTALAAGDFDGDYRDELITAFSNQNHNNTIISMCTPDHGGGLGDPNNTVNHIYGPASYYYVTAMTAGDFDGDRTDRLVTAFWNQTYNETAITLCTPNQGGGAGNPGHGSNYIYHSAIDGLHVTAMTAGSFRESLEDPENYLWKQTTSNQAEIENDAGLPKEFSISSNYPNPFNPSTQIQYELPYEEKVQITIFDLYGRKVNTLINENRPAGTHVVTWNGKDKSGRTVSSGVYFYKISAGNFIQTKKMTLIR